MKKIAVMHAMSIVMAAAALAAEKPVDKVAETLKPWERHTEIVINKPYLVVPLRGTGNQGIRLIVDGKVVRLYSKVGVARTEAEADFWGFIEVAEFKGKTASLEAKGHGVPGFELMRQDDKVPGQEKWGSEPKRPQFHFSQKVGWNNDPNGLVYLDGEWHLYFQHNPMGWPWGSMSWGHAVSRDLVNWEQLPVALHYEGGMGMWSGGGAVDHKNAGGWKTGTNDVIIVTWTHMSKGECIAYSNDKGRTFTPYEGNPIFKHNGRDPKPFWYAYDKDDKPLNDAAAKRGGHWVIAVSDQPANVGMNTAFYTSSDLKEWTVQSHLKGYRECAEVFTLAVDGNPANMRWVTFGGDAQYAIGDFDGKTFTPDPGKKRVLHHNGGFYASQCFSAAPAGRRVQVGWATGIDFKGLPFNQTFSFPTELTLRTTPDGVRLFGEPVKEIEKVHGKTQKVENQPLDDGRAVEFKTGGALFDICAVWEVGTAKQVGLAIDGREEFLYDVAEAKIKDLAAAKTAVVVAAKSKSKSLDVACPPVDGKISVRILIDRPMKETFVNRGAMIFNAPYENDLNIESVKAWARGGAAKLVSLEVYEIDATWP